MVSSRLPLSKPLKDNKLNSETLKLISIIDSKKINENDENIAGTSQNTINFAPPKTTETDKSNTLPPPVFLKLEKHYMEQLKTLNEIIPTLRSKKTGELIKLYTNNSHDYELLQDSVEKTEIPIFHHKT
ncbi:hypothetical protein TNCV_287901 [Trichonephila clavipes]|nr:hypothetical protein TNCV_287901 [Trichonephila clavipes]